MNVSELISQLEYFHPNMEVLISSDEEGNNFRPVSLPQKEIIVREDKWHIDVIAEEDINEFETDELEPAVILW